MITVLSQRALKLGAISIVRVRKKLWGARLPAPKIFYFGYGANLDPDRFAKYAMNAEPQGVAHLPDYKISISLPCEYLGKGYASVDPAPGKQVWGFLYALDPYAMALLDIMEYAVFRHYRRVKVTVINSRGARVTAYTYRARFPVRALSASLIYRLKISEAARRHGFPEKYIAEIERLPAKEKFELDPGFSLLLAGRRRFLERRLARWYLHHDRIREWIAEKLSF